MAAVAALVLSVPQVHAYTVEEEPVHQYLAREAGTLQGVPSIVRAGIWNDMYTPLETGCKVQFDPLDDVVVGAGEEDREETPLCWTIEEPRYGFVERVFGDGGRNGLFEHFFNPDVVRDVGPYHNGMVENGFYNQGLSVSILLVVPPRNGHYDSALRLAEDYYFNYALPLYLGGDWDEGLYWLGRVAHLVADMTVPAHVHLVAHDVVAGVDSYESLFTRRPDLLYRETGVRYRTQAYRTAQLPNMGGFSWQSIHPRGEVPSELVKLLWYTAQKTQYGAVVTDGTTVRGNGRYTDRFNVSRAFPTPLWTGEAAVPITNPVNLTETTLPRHARALLSHAIRAIAGVYVLFGEDVERYRAQLEWWESSILPAGKWQTVQHSFTTAANLEVGKVTYAGRTMSVREAVAQKLLVNQAYEYVGGAWRTFPNTDLDEWRFRPGVSYSVQARVAGVKLFLRAVEGVPRLTTTYNPLPAQ